MKCDVIRLEQDVEKIEKELIKFAEDEIEYTKIFEKYIVKEKVILKYMKAKKYLEQERSKLLKDYNILLDKPFKKEIILQIKQEVKEKFIQVKEPELNHFANNVYVYTTLLANCIAERDIVKQLLYLNNKFFYEFQEDGIIEDSKINCDLDFLKNLSQKYISIIKEKVK